MSSNETKVMAWKMTKESIVKETSLTAELYTELRNETMEVCRRYLSKKWSARSEANKMEARTIAVASGLEEKWKARIENDTRKTSDFWPAWLGHVNPEIRPDDRVKVPETPGAPGSYKVEIDPIVSAPKSVLDAKQDRDFDDIGSRVSELSVQDGRFKCKWSQVKLKIDLSRVRIKKPMMVPLICTVTKNDLRDHHIQDTGEISVVHLNLNLLQSMITAKALQKDQVDVNFLEEHRLVYDYGQDIVEEIELDYEFASVMQTWLANERRTGETIRVCTLQVRPMMDDEPLAFVPSPSLERKRKLSPIKEQPDENCGDDDNDDVVKPHNKRRRVQSEPILEDESPESEPDSDQISRQPSPSLPEEHSDHSHRQPSASPSAEHDGEVMPSETQTTLAGEDEHDEQDIDPDIEIMNMPDSPRLDAGDLLTGQLTEKQFDEGISLGSANRNDEDLDIDIATATPDDFLEATMSTRVAEQITPEGARNLREFYMLEGSKLRALSENDHLPTPGMSRSSTPGQAYTCEWAAQNERDIGGGVIAHQMGFGKTHTMYAYAVWLRAYVNKLWSDWKVDESRAEKNPSWVRRHNPMPVVKPEFGAPSELRCPSRKMWKVECPCELRNTYHKHPFKDGWTLILALARALKDPWVNEFIAMTQANTLMPDYKNEGFGKAHGFILDDNQPFRIVVCHEASLSKKGDGYLGPLPKDVGLLEPRSTDDRIRPKRFTDRIVVITSAESMNNQLYQMLWPKKLNNVYNKRGTVIGTRQEPDGKLIWPAVIAIDEAHENKSIGGKAPRVVTEITRKIKQVHDNNVGVEVPSLWLLTGTPYTTDIWGEFADVWLPCWRELKRLQGVYWEKHDVLKYFTGDSIEEQHKTAKHLSGAISNPSNVTPKAFKKLAKAHKANTVRIMKCFIIKYDETTRFWNIRVIILPNVQVVRINCELDDEQQRMVNDPLKTTLAEVQKDVQKKRREWVKNKKKGNMPTLVSQYFKTGHCKPLNKAVINFPWVIKLLIQYRADQEEYNELNDPFIKEQGTHYSDLTADEQREFNTLTLTMAEVEEHNWYSRTGVKQSPYYKYRNELWSTSHKTKKIENWVQKVRNGRSQIYMNTVSTARGKPRGRQIKGIIVTDSPVTAVILFAYIEFEMLGGKGLCALSTSATSQKDRNIIYDWHQGRLLSAPTGPAFKDLVEPIFIIATQGIFGTGQNMSRATEILLVEPPPNAFKAVQTPARIRRKGGKEPLTQTTLYSKQAMYEELSMRKVDGYVANLQEILASTLKDGDVPVDDDEDMVSFVISDDSSDEECA